MEDTLEQIVMKWSRNNENIYERWIIALKEQDIIDLEMLITRSKDKQGWKMTLERILSNPENIGLHSALVEWKNELPQYVCKTIYLIIRDLYGSFVMSLLGLLQPLSDMLSHSSQKEEIQYISSTVLYSSLPSDSTSINGITHILEKQYPRLRTNALNVASRKKKK